MTIEPTTGIRSYRLDLPWSTPPLTANLRLSWPVRARLTRDVRTTVGWLAKAARIPPAAHCTVTLVWAPGDCRRRDADNLVATLKPCADGLVDAGIVPDDTPALMTKRMPQILPPPHPVGMWLDVETTTSSTEPG